MLMVFFSATWHQKQWKTLSNGGECLREVCNMILLSSKTILRQLPVTHLTASPGGF